MKSTRSLRSVGIGLVAMMIAAMASLIATNPAGAQTNVSSLQIVEGQGIGDLVTLGQTPQEISSAIQQFGTSCSNFYGKCTFRLTSSSPVVAVHFGADGRAARIDVTQSSTPLSQRWTTTAGAAEGMSVQQVQGLYPGSQIVRINAVKSEVRADGLTYGALLRCYQTCRTLSTISVVPGSGTGGNTGGTGEGGNTGGTGGGGEGGNTGGGTVVDNDAEFDGTIDVRTRFRGAAELRITITDPNGGVTTASEQVRLQRNRTTSLDPADYLSEDGPEGTYNYRVDVVKTRRNGTQRVVARVNGSFTLG